MNEKLIEYIRERMSEFQSQNHLADKAGISRGAMSRLMNGYPVRIETLKGLASALRVNVTTLIELAERQGHTVAPDPEADQVIELFGQLGAKDRAEVLRILRMKVEHSEGEAYGKKKVG